MRMQKRQFRIGELAKRLDVERFVIRFWEKEFKISPQRSHGGQRFYDEKDFATFSKIKKLLYQEGFTINGARQQLKQNKDTEILGSHKTTIENPTEIVTKKRDEEFIKRIKLLKKKLLDLSKSF